jgi:3-oxoacyl-[acyl-carrier-protein] synthase II
MSEYPRPSGRVVVTGIGAVTPLATGIEPTWAKVLAGANAIGRITHLDPSAYTTQIAAEVKDFNAEDYLDKKEARRVDRFIALAVASATMALEDSKLPINDDNREDIGVLVGSGIGGLSTLADNYKKQLESGPGKVSPFLVPYMIPDMASGYISIVHKVKGPNICSVSACSTSANCIGDAYHIVKRGDATAMLAGGTEAPVNSIGLGGFCAARALSTRNDDPSHACRPFDLNRDGFIMGEGSTVLLLEDYDHAKARGAKIYGEIVGYGMTGDAYHITQPDPEGMGAYRAIRNALVRAGVKPEEVDYVNAHGTSTHLNDKLETMAIKKALGDHAYKTAVSSTKSMMGHMLGAAGAVEAAMCLLAMRDGILPPTINYETPDPECDLDYVPNKARKADIKVALSNSFGFGGHNVCLAFKKLD